MLKLDDTLYFSSISYNAFLDSYWGSIYDQCDHNGRFILDLSKRINPLRYVTRNGEWSTPWKQELIPGHEMPVYDPTFNKSFEQISDEQAMLIKHRINQGEKFVIMYSGGIDSSVIMVALIKNLTTEELQSVSICTTPESIIEHPSFWEKYIQGKFQLIDGTCNKYDNLIEQGLTPITADEGDCIFGTVLGLTLYSNYDFYISDMQEPVKSNLAALKYKISNPDIHYSAYKEIIIKHLTNGGNPLFGRLLYEKYDHNIKTASVPVHSLHDFFWWAIFNVKYLNCAVRGALYFNDQVEWKTAMDTIVNWFSYPDYQRWSMANNNNGQKINSTLASYKAASKDYIWSLDKDDWYRNFKIKLESLWVLTIRQDVSKLSVDRMPSHRVGLTKDYEMLYANDPGVKEYFTHHLTNYKIDWADI